MRTWMWTVVLLFAATGVAFAQDTAAKGDEIPPSLKTYAGIAVLTTMLLGAAKKMWEGWVKGKEPLLAIAFPVLLGVLGKLTGAGFADVDWMSHLIALVLSGVGSGLIHDKFVNPLIKGKNGGGSANPS